MNTSKENTLDTLHRCLANKRRRMILYYLHRTEDGVASLDDFVDYIVSQEANSSAPDSTRVAIALYHKHLPMLADCGLIDFDRRTETARYSPDSTDDYARALLDSQEAELAKEFS
ncbi:DUF7344 domain-containing protein [Haloarcula marina]|uniref:DUF7344 domain-containing protein n=1 Tax=Haloarcula marina TaxID=2961574 RepID=UPI0020B8886A|nr:hypothetical protein [Halomicroarcula marina]